MPSRLIAARELAELLAVFAHPDRVRIVEELRRGESDVTTLGLHLTLAQPTVSQHLAKLRAHRIVSMRRAQHHVYYALAHPALARWLIDGLEFVGSRADGAQRLSTALEEARSLWGSTAAPRRTGRRKRP